MIEDILVKELISVKECLKKLNKGATGVLFVVDNSNKLIGSLSDGDIRRGLLSNVKLEDTIVTIYNKNPFFISKGYLEEDVKRIFLDSKIELLPIIDSRKCIIGSLAWEDFFDNKIEKIVPELDIPVVIMAGGKGTRMEPFTNVLPKPLIPIGDKTIMELIIDEFRAYNIKDFYFTLNYKGRMIEAYFNSLEKDYNTYNLWETEFEGTAGSLKLLPDNIDDNFILSNCDVIVKADYSDALKNHIESNAWITVLSSIQHYTIPYGVVEFKNNGEITGLKEKPEYTFPINTGVYIVNKKSLDIIPKGQVFHMTHLVENLIKDGKKVITYPVNESDYIDIGQWNEYRDVIKKLV